MGKQFDHLQEDHVQFIKAQHIFFCGSAALEGKVNISPKGMDSLRILGPNRIVWRNFTGSGNETAGHIALNPRMTLMWCGFEKRPMIMRAYGQAVVLHPRDDGFQALNDLFPPQAGLRQIYDMQVEMLQTSCGYAVPFYEHQGPRDVLKHWSEQKGVEGLHEYWETRNQSTLDGFETHILDET